MTTVFGMLRIVILLKKERHEYSKMHDASTSLSILRCRKEVMCVNASVFVWPSIPRSLVSSAHVRQRGILFYGFSLFFRFHFDGYCIGPMPHKMTGCRNTPKEYVCVPGYHDDHVGLDGMNTIQSRVSLPDSSFCVAVTPVDLKACTQAAPSLKLYL